MRPLLRRVDRVQRLTTFESAARLGSFSAAGRELGMAQPAVTRQVQALERALGITLFERQSNRVALTAAGRTLAESLDTSFRAIEYAIEEVAQLDDVFVLAMPPGFAQQLVVPGLDSLQRALGDRDLRLWLYDRESELGSGTYDAAVRVGAGPWPGLDASELFPERAMPVASPGLAATLGLDATSAPEEVLAAPLLHTDVDGRPWMAWADWLEEFELSLTPVRRRVVLNSWPAVLQQALAGRGVALGWAGLIEDLVEGGALSVVGPTVTSDRSYCVTWNARRSNSSIDALVDWLHTDLDERSGRAPT